MIRIFLTHMMAGIVLIYYWIFGLFSYRIHLLLKHCVNDMIGEITLPNSLLLKREWERQKYEEMCDNGRD